MRHPEDQSPRSPSSPPDRDFIQVGPSGIHGSGVFAKRTIPRGTRVIEYAGRRLSLTQLRDEADRGLRKLTYVLNLDADTVIDGAEGGNAARFVNHCCEPNCDVYIFDDTPYLYAMAELPAGTELTFDYKLRATDAQRISRALSRELFPCHCGSPRCRGTLVAPPKTSASARRPGSPTTPPPG